MVATRGAGLLRDTETQSGISGGPPGNNSAQSDFTWTDGSGNGWRIGSIPAYGGADASPWYEIDANTVSITELSLATTQADGFVHMEAVVGSSFLGSEQFTYTLTELAPQNTYFRAYLDSGTSAADANGVTWRVRQAIYPGDPGMIFTRIDMGNPSGSSISLTGSSDPVDYDPIAGLIQSLQGGVNAWQPANGGYGTVGGSRTSGWSTTYASGDPDWYDIVPQTGAGLSLGLVGVRKTKLTTVSGAGSVQFAANQNATRLKMNVKATIGATIPATTTYPFYFASFIRRNLAQSSEPASFAADYLAPDAGFTNLANGTLTGWSDDEGLYVFATTSGSSLSFQHSISGNVTERWNPAYKVTGWTARKLPVKVVIGATTLTNDVDYVTYLDAVNSVLYVKLLRPIVASGATGNQLNNGTITISDGPTPAAPHIRGVGGI